MYETASSSQDHTGDWWAVNGMKDRYLPGRRNHQRKRPKRDHNGQEGASLEGVMKVKLGMKRS